jgi:uncharacterized protein (TIGR01777 family)
MSGHLRVLVAGATGMLGRPLVTALLAEGYEVHVLSRTAGAWPVAGEKVVVHAWNPAAASAAMAGVGLDRVDVVINLAGASISSIPWTAKRRRNILASRVDATRALVTWMTTLAKSPAALINASGISTYGDRGDELLTESASPGAGFLTDVVTTWEGATEGAPSRTRVVFLRTGLVVAATGALTPLRLLTRFFVAGPLAGGKAWWPWISLHDEIRAIIHLVTSKISGPVNLVGPTPATTGSIMKSLARQMKRPYWLPAPAFAIRLLLGEAGQELLLNSERAVPEVLLRDGFTFTHQSADEAIAWALGKA